MYAITVRPYEYWQANALYIYNEMVFILTFGILLIVNIWDFDDVAQSSLGWIIIGIVLLSLALTWITLFPPIVEAAYRQIRELCTRPTASSVAQNEANSPKQPYNKTNKDENVTASGATPKRIDTAHARMKQQS